MRQCGVDGCSERHYARSLCRLHYQRQLRGRELNAKPHRFSERPEYAEARRLYGMGLGYKEISKLLGVDKSVLVRALKDMPGQDERRSKYWQLLPYIQQGMSFSEIRKTTGSDYRTVRRWFPNYQPFAKGGSGEANEIRKANGVMRDMDNFGNVLGGKRKEGK